jgi:amino acid adenylation domain-containing protein
MATAGSQEESLTLHALFTAVCERQPDRIAVTLGKEKITYAQLDETSDRIAAGLVERGVRPGCIVALCLERSIPLIAAMLGVLKAGAAYLPLDPLYPRERLAETIADAAPSLVIAESNSNLRRLPSSTLFAAIESLLATPRPLYDLPVADQDAAYVIYTSGSTGKPKGVIVTHRNVVRLLANTQGRFRFTHEDVWTMFHSCSFDFSVWEIWGCLLHGGRLVIVPYSISRSPDEFHALLRAESVTVLNQTPSAFVLLNAADERAATRLVSLRLIVFGGEALPPALLASWFTRHPQTAPELVNMYGITETTVHVTWRTMRAADAANERESLIGEPIPGVELYLLDEELKPVEPGAEGEICVSGEGVASGYLNRPELTAERFIQAPFLATKSARLYRSGDRARRRADGELVYLGRRDGQVKINGFRIEAGEIEAAMLALPGIQQACVLARNTSAATAEAVATPGETRLAAYFVADRPLAAQTLRSQLAGHLPAHMLPSFYVQMAELPINSNGKIDRKALPEPKAGLSSSNLPYTVAASPAEQRIAQIWRQVLRTDEVALDANFFEVGGTSLLLIALRSELEREFSRAIPVTWMFEATTVRALAKRLSGDTIADTSGTGLEPELPSGLNLSASLEVNARKQRDAFARARAQKNARRSIA